MSTAEPVSLAGLAAARLRKSSWPAGGLIFAADVRSEEGGQFIWFV